MVGVSPKLAIDGPCSVAHVDAGDPTGSKESLNFVPDRVQTLVHPVVRTPPSPAANRSPIAGGSDSNVSSQSSIIGYGGDVTTSSTESSPRAIIDRLSPTWTACSVSTTEPSVWQAGKAIRSGPRSDRRTDETMSFF